MELQNNNLSTMLRTDLDAFAPQSWTSVNANKLGNESSNNNSVFSSAKTCGSFEGAGFNDLFGYYGDLNLATPGSAAQKPACLMNQTPLIDLLPSAASQIPMSDILSYVSIRKMGKHPC